MGVDEMKAEIVASIQSSGRGDDTLMKHVDWELNRLASTDGLGNKNNLKEFYGIWKEMIEKNEIGLGQHNDLQSWTAWALGMTVVKPTAKPLPTRRCFARVGLPDIDTDFEFFRRGEVYNYIIQKWGREFVANIGTYGMLKLKSVIRRIGKALDIAKAFHKGRDICKTENEAMVTEIIKSLPKQRGSKLKATDENGKEVEIKTVEDAYKYCPDFRFYLDNYPLIRKYAKHIEGLLAQFGMHAAGIVISDTPIERLCPLRPAKKKKSKSPTGETITDVAYATQFVYDDLEKIGLIKLDILALASLSVIDRCVKMVKKNYDIDIDINNLPLNDKKTLDLYKTGKLTGVFQCETYPMQNVMKEIGVDCFEDICAATALFRPGPMDNIPSYCQRKKGLEEVDYFHPTIEKFVKPILEETYGFCVYQEQIMFVCNALAGFTVSEGYDMIKGVGKKLSDVINKYRSRFVEGCVGNGVPKDVAEQYWENFIVKFANYGFNRAHSAAYGLVSFQTAYLKAHFPEEFFICSLNVANEAKDHEQVEALERDLRNFEITLLPRKLNTCDVDFRIVRKKDVTTGVTRSEIMPSIMCKGVGYLAAKSIADGKPFKDLRELSAKTDAKLVGTEVLGALIDAGFFNEYIKKHSVKGEKRLDKDTLIEQYGRIREDLKKAAKLGVVSMDMFAGMKKS